MKFKIITPSEVIIEKTAGEFAATFFEACRSSDMSIIDLQGKKINLLRYNNNPRLFAKAHLEKFIPAAVAALIDVMSKDSTPVDQKEVIYQAIQERVNDEQVNAMGKSAMLPEFEKTVFYKPDNEKPKPLIINSEKV